jgi:hypothetical protein
MRSPTWQPSHHDVPAPRPRGSPPPSPQTPGCAARWRGPTGDRDPGAVDHDLDRLCRKGFRDVGEQPDRARLLRDDGGGRPRSVPARRARDMACASGAPSRSRTCPAKTIGVPGSSSRMGSAQTSASPPPRRMRTGPSRRMRHPHHRSAGADRRAQLHPAGRVQLTGRVGHLRDHQRVRLRGARTPGACRARQDAGSPTHRRDRLAQLLEADHRGNRYFSSGTVVECAQALKNPLKSFPDSCWAMASNSSQLALPY